MKKENFNQMTLAEQIAYVQSLTIGSIHTVVYRKPIVFKSAKYAGASIVKVSVIQGRFGLEYGDNLGLVKEAHENGMGYGILRGFHEVVPNYVYANDKTNAPAFRFFPFNGSMHKTVYYEDGVETTLEALVAKGYPKSELSRSGSQPPVLALYASNIVSIA